MPKRPHSPSLDSVLSVKYAHNSSVNHPNQRIASNFDTVLSDETVLAIFTFLDPYQLCLVRLVNKHWGRLATDNHLWRIMFLREFSRSRLRGSRGFTTLSNREIRPLPSRVRPHGEELGLNDDLPENYTDWRWMFRISSNWSRGRCTATVQRASPLPAFGCSQLAPPDGLVHFNNYSNFSQTSHVLLVGDLTIYASGQASLAPTVYIFRDSINSGLRIRYGPSLGSPVSVTTLCLDHSSASTRLAIFYSDRSWAIRTVDYERRHIAMDYTYSSRNLVSGAAIIQAAFHHPLLVTLSASFRMCIYHLQTPPAPPQLTHTLSSYSGFAPLTMTIARYRTPDQYRVLLAYASPIYPAHWGPSATDITISTHSASDLSQSLVPHDSSHVRILSSSSTNNQLPVGWIPDGTPDAVPEELRLRWLRKVSHVSGIQTDGRFVVFASEDGGIQVYRLLRNARLLYERTLFPPTHAPSPRALSVADSRCVCATGDGRLWVWDLESGVGIQATAVHSTSVLDGPETDIMGPTNNEIPPNKPPTIIRVSFDAHKIVAVDINDSLHTYSFDT
ncbi:unnamed protein product [Rhizoctonia solani]|uniref:F-box domain-containing protein n=1 Tax=Rhizoctonia solani TaxID=456999 RepID=A0A8H3B2M7_9AGAM|nr:unnamed protein product [Rhizoctonia solani]